MRRGFAIALGFAAAVSLAPVPAPAQTVPGQEVARRLFDEGVELEGQKSFAAALAKFREAEQIRGTPALRFHKAFCLEHLGKLSAALDEYEAAERTARDQNKQETLRSAQARLAALRPRVPQLAVKVVPSNAEVLLDGVALAAPLVANGTKFRVDPGAHEIVARAPEHAPQTRRLTLAEGASQQVELTLERSATPEASSTPTAPAAEGARAPQSEARALAITPPPAPGAPSRSIALPVATTAGAVALVAGGLVAFVLAGSAADDGREACATKRTCDDERTKVRTLDALSLSGVVAGAALGGLSAVLWLSKPSASDASATRLRVGASGIVLEGSL